MLRTFINLSTKSPRIFTAAARPSSSLQMVKRKRTTTAAQLVEEDVAIPQIEEVENSTRPRRARKKAIIEQSEDELAVADELEAKPAKKARKSKKKATVEENEANGTDAVRVEKTEEELTVTPTKAKRVRKKAAVTEQEDFSPEKEKKPRKKREPKPEPVYIIPDVERKETTFKGRLGYACLNTILRNKKPAKEAIFCSRTCRIDSIKKNGMDWVKDLGRQNTEDLLKLIEWNEENNIKFMRISSELFPFASHGKYGYTLEYCAGPLAKIGEFANKHGHRLTTHPGQFTQLGSPKPEVVDSAIRELEYHCEMLDRMGIGPDGVMIIHGGGVYDDKPGALARIKNTISTRLAPKVRARLVLENDELCYNAEDLLPICEELDVPLVFDYHHDALYPSSIPPKEIIERANAIFKKRGIRPKQHLSEPRPGAETLMERRAHADRCQTLPVDLPDDMDLMIEAKDKEQAVLHLYRIYNLHPVIHANLRPPAENQTKETKGRKSNKKAKAAAAGGEEAGMELDDGEPLTELEDNDDASGAALVAPDPDSAEGILQADAALGIAVEAISPEVAAIAAQQAAMLGVPAMPIPTMGPPQPSPRKTRAQRKQPLLEDTQPTPTPEKTGRVQRTRSKRPKANVD